MKRWILLSTLAALLGGCSVLPARPQIDLYTPMPSFSGQRAGTPVAWRLSVAKVQATGFLASPRILVRPLPEQIEVYPQAHWSEPAPGLVETALMQALEADPRIAVVERSGSGLPSDFLLQSELRDFQMELGSGTPQAVLRLRVSLVAQAQSRVVSSRVFEARQLAGGQDIDAAIPAFSAVLSDLGQQISDWVVQQGEAAYTAQGEARTPLR